MGCTESWLWVTMLAGTAYQIDESADTSEGANYTSVRSSGCGSGTSHVLAPGEHATCTITLSDPKATMLTI